MNLDYHIEIEKHFYSVPFRLLREEVEARITAKSIPPVTTALRRVADLWRE